LDLTFYALCNVPSKPGKARWRFIGHPLIGK
jgi:hypothetical protein